MKNVRRRHALARSHISSPPTAPGQNLSTPRRHPLAAAERRHVPLTRRGHGEPRAQMQSATPLRKKRWAPFGSRGCCWRMLRSTWPPLRQQTAKGAGLCESFSTSEGAYVLRTRSALRKRAERAWSLEMLAKMFFFKPNLARQEALNDDRRIPDIPACAQAARAVCGQLPGFVLLARAHQLSSP